MPDDSSKSACQNRYGLALSGGGFRATLFHLGVVRALAEAGRLDEVSEIASVSGGSILAAHLVCNWERYVGQDASAFENAAKELIDFVQWDVRGRILRRLPWVLIVRAVLRVLSFIVPTKGIKGRLDRWRERCSSVHLLGRYFDKKLFKDEIPLRKLPDTPNLAILATDVATMKHGWFCGHGFLLPNEFSDHPRGRDLLSVGHSVAASCAFPALFPPVRLAETMYGFGDGHDRLVTDAGVYDNLGLSAFAGAPFKESTFNVFASDATATRSWSRTRRLNLLSNLLRSVDIIQQAATDSQRRLAGLPLRDYREGKPSVTHASNSRFVLFDIAQEEIVDDPNIPTDIQRCLSYVRTDLDAFSCTEICNLVHHGYSVAWNRLRAEKLIAPGYESQFLKWCDLWPLERRYHGDPPSLIKKSVAALDRARISKLRLFSLRDYVGIANLLIFITALLTAVALLWFHLPK